MVETRGDAAKEKKSSKSKKPNLKEEKSCAQKMGKKHVCTSDKKRQYKKVSPSEKESGFGSKRKDHHSEEDKGKKKMKLDGGQIPSSDEVPVSVGDDVKVSFIFLLIFCIVFFYFVSD